MYDNGGLQVGRERVGFFLPIMMTENFITYT